MYQWVILLAGALVVLRVSSAQEQLDWWKTAVFYQVYPRSFKDSDGDGVGDLKGITEKVPHLKNIGITGVWLSPIFKSPMKDFGYDISDFRDIDPTFGTMADFDELAATVKDAGLKLVLDFVPNHSSDEHDWFLKSVAKEEPYTDFYTWMDPKGFNDTNAPIPPNNWLSVFGGSAWQWVEERQQFYLHQFVAGQPDLNYRNPSVLQEMKDVLTFWLDKGVDGFRMDAVPHMMEDQRFLDEPPSNLPEATPDQWRFLNHVFTVDQPELYDVVREFRATVDAAGDDKVMMVEAYTNISNTMLYYGNETHPGAHFPFNFQLITSLSNQSVAQDLGDSVSYWMDNLPEGAWPNWVIGNHDQKRVAARFGNDFSMALQMVSLLLPGTGITYNGEEINMENTWISWKDTRDPQGCQAGPDYYEEFSRDPERTPFQWSGEKNAGFSSGDTTWLPVNENYVDLNLEVQKLDRKSPYNLYKNLISARQLPAAQYGNFIPTVLQEENVFSFVREVPAINGSSILVMVNLGHSNATVNIDTLITTLNDEYPRVLVATEGSDMNHMDNITSSEVPVPARGGLVLLYDAASAASAAVISTLVLSMAAALLAMV